MRDLRLGIHITADALRLADAVGLAGYAQGVGHTAWTSEVAAADGFTPPAVDEDDDALREQLRHSIVGYGELAAFGPARECPSWLEAYAAAGVRTLIVAPVTAAPDHAEARRRAL